MEEIIKKLKNEIINHDLIKNSSLFSSPQWKRAHYIILSEIISERLSKSEFMQGSKKNDLGISISSSTLQRVFTNSYSDKGNTDLRFLKTLDKLAIFLGYPNLNNFLLHRSQSENTLFKNEQLNAVEGVDAMDTPISFFTELITNYCREEFEVIKKIPELHPEPLLEFVFAEGPLYKRATDMLSKFSERNLHLNCENNRSNFENYGFKVRNVTTDSIVITSKEFWNMHWVDSNGKTTYIVNRANNQLYFFRKIKGVWKIWDNHNPGYESLASDFLKNEKL
nr:hypothetical protein [uncultured Flavobacterium sp.]